MNQKEAQEVKAIEFNVVKYVEKLKREKEAADQRADDADVEAGRLRAQRDILLKRCKKLIVFWDHGGWSKVVKKSCETLDAIKEAL